MSNETEAKKKSAEAKKRDRAAIWRAGKSFFLIGIGAILILGILIVLSFFYFDRAVERLQFVTVNALSSFVLAVIALQAIIYARQWNVMNQNVKQTKSIIRAAQRQARTAERALHSSDEAHRIENRPYVGVIKVEMSDSVLSMNPIRIHAIGTNAGKTPAINYESRIYTKASSFSEIPSGIGEFKKIGLSDKGILLPGVITGLPADLPAEHITRMSVRNDPNMRLYVWGTIDYDDIWGDHHRTEFSFVNGDSRDRTQWWPCNTGNTMSTNDALPKKEKDGAEK
jgi:type II secretory pathway pseudopilin PulG